MVMLRKGLIIIRMNLSIKREKIARFVITNRNLMNSKFLLYDGINPFALVFAQQCYMSSNVYDLSLQLVGLAYIIIIFPCHISYVQNIHCTWPHTS